MFLTNNLQRICQRRRRDNGGAVLVIMENGNIQHSLQRLFYIEALRRFYIFKVNAAKGRRNCSYDLDDFIRVMGIYFDIEHINVSKFFKQYTFSLHNWLAGERAAVAESQNGGTVRDDCNQISLGCVLIGVIRILFDLQNRLCNARRVRQTQVTLGIHRLGGHNGNLAGFTLQTMVFKCVFARKLSHTTSCDVNYISNYSTTYTINLVPFVTILRMLVPRRGGK